MPQLCVTHCFSLCWWMLWWKTFHVIREALLYGFFSPWVSFLPVRVPAACTAILTITFKEPYCSVLVYFIMQRWNGWFKIANNRSWYEPATQTEDIHSEKNCGLNDLTMSNFLNFLAVLGCAVRPFRRDKCCHLLLPYHIAWLQPTSGPAPLLGESAWPHVCEALSLMASGPLTSTLARCKPGASQVQVGPSPASVTNNSYSEKSEKSCWLIGRDRCI